MGASRPGAAGGVRIAPSVQNALQAGAPVVALESALITHGLPFPKNVETAQQMQSAVAAEGAVAATIAVLKGEIIAGATADQVHALGIPGAHRKIGVRDLAAASLQGLSGGTTVAATMFAASKAGIKVFATGGIGGIHRENPFDVSADLETLSEIPMIVICAGAKAILDLRATLERLETMSVPVIGYGAGEFPAFYSRASGLSASLRLDSPEEIAGYWTAHCALGMRSAVLVANPIPEDSEIPRGEIEALISQASSEARKQDVHGQALTPFLLQRLADLSGGRSIEANVTLLVNNARLAARVAVAVQQIGTPQESGA